MITENNQSQTPESPSNRILNTQENQTPDHDHEKQDPKPDIVIELKQQKTETTEIEKLSEPFWFSIQLQKYPCRVFLGLLSLILTFIAIVFLGGFFKMNSETWRDFLVWSDQKVINQDAFSIAQDIYGEELESSQELTERSIQIQQTLIIYKLKKGDTLLIPENVKVMQKVEKYLTTYNNKEYEKFCEAKSMTDLSCEDPQSIPFILGNGNYDAEITQQTIDQTLTYISQDEEALQETKGLLDKNFDINNPKVNVARSVYTIAFPLKGFKDTSDPEQSQKFKEWNTKFFDYISEDQSSSDVEVLMFNRRSIFDYNNNQLNKDIIFSGIALVFVTIYMILHTKSVGVGLIGSLIMLLTFPLSYFFYNLIFQIKYLISLHTSILFLLMGIGADDIFVYFDSWQQAAQIKEINDNILKKISYSYRRASKAMLVTSSTTVIAFLATAVSKLMPIMTFGIFAAINIAMNYLMTITLFPAFLAFREQYQKKTTKNNTRSSTVIDQSQIDKIKSQQQQEQKSSVKLEEESKVQKLFKTKWNSFTFKFRYPIIAFFFCLLIFNIVATLQLKTPIKPPSMIQDSHFLLRARESLREDFSSTEGHNINIYFVYGLKGVNKEDVSYYDPGYAGEVIFDEDFDLTSQYSQQRIIEICQQIKSQNYKKLVQQNEDSVSCHMENFKNFIENEKSQTYPVDPSQFNSLMKEFLSHDSGYQASQSYQIGFIDNKVKYFVIIVTGNELGANGRKILESLYEKYEQMLKDINVSNEKGLQNPFQTSGSWLWMVSEKALLDGAIQGIIISLIMAFIVLVLSTMNIVMSFYAILSIVGVVLGVLMVIWARGWEFGTFESMNSIIIIGLSVDYVVHLTNSYVESHYETKYERTQDMLATMGVSVLGGGFTTLGAGLFLFGGQLMFFQIMGTLVTATIGFSLMWALIFLPALSHVIGMQRKQGDLKTLIQKIKNKPTENVINTEKNEIQ